jgi:hypothetical protein
MGATVDLCWSVEVLGPVAGYCHRALPAPCQIDHVVLLRVLSSFVEYTTTMSDCQDGG